MIWGSLIAYHVVHGLLASGLAGDVLENLAPGHQVGYYGDAAAELYLTHVLRMEGAADLAMALAMGALGDSKLGYAMVLIARLAFLNPCFRELQPANLEGLMPHTAETLKLAPFVALACAAAAVIGFAFTGAKKDLKTPRSSSVLANGIIKLVAMFEVLLWITISSTPMQAWSMLNPPGWSTNKFSKLGTSVILLSSGYAGGCMIASNLIFMILRPTRVAATTSMALHLIIAALGTHTKMLFDMRKASLGSSQMVDAIEEIVNGAIVVHLVFAALMAVAWAAGSPSKAKAE